MTDPANVGHRTGHRVFCKACRVAYRSRMWLAPLPWGDARECAQGHDVSLHKNIGHRSKNGEWEAFCRQCEFEGRLPSNRGRNNMPNPDEGDDAWMPFGNCVGTKTPELYHTDCETARKVLLECLSCPVAEQCGAYADKYRHSGMWGGVWRYKNTAGNYRKYAVHPFTGA